MRRGLGVSFVLLVLFAQGCRKFTKDQALLLGYNINSRDLILK